MRLPCIDVTIGSFHHLLKHHYDKTVTKHRLKSKKQEYMSKHNQFLKSLCLMVSHAAMYTTISQQKQLMSRGAN